MHAFTRPSKQLRRRIRHALLRSLHYTSLYRRLILKNIEVGTNTQTVGRAVHRHLTTNHWEGTNFLKFVYGLLYNGKLAKRYGHSPTDDCPICHKPDSCAHILGQWPYHKTLTISHHIASCQLVHVAIRKSAKGGGALHKTLDLVLVTADVGLYPPTSQSSLETLSSAQNSGGEQRRHDTPQPLELSGPLTCRHTQQTTHGCLTRPKIYPPEPYGNRLRCRVHDGTLPDNPMGTTDRGNTCSLPGRPRHNAGPHIRQRSPGQPRPGNHQLR